MSFRLVATLAFVLGIAPAFVTAAEAQEGTSTLQFNVSASFASTALQPALLNAAEGQLPQPRVQLPREITRPRATTAILTSLYVSTAAMQALDVHSTLRALNQGAVEANPMMSPLTKNPAAFIAVKAGVAASTIFAARSLAKRNKVAAIVTLAAINSAYAMVVSHNFKVARQLR